MSGTTLLTTHSHIPKTLNLQHQCCENLKVSKNIDTRNFSCFPDTDNAACVPLVRETGKEVNVTHELKHGILTHAIKRMEASAIPVHDSVGNVDNVQEHLKTTLEESKKKGRW
jgi:hypothetical protein